MPVNNNRYNLNLGNALGSAYGRLRGYNPLSMLRGFGNDFRTAAGIPANAPLWTRAGGIQLGNMPTISEYTLNNTLNNAGSWQVDGINRLLSAGDTINPQELSLLRDAAAKSQLPFDVTKDVTATASTPGTGTSLGQLSRWGMGIYQGGKALKGLYDNLQSDKDLNDIKKDISLQIASNPMYDMYLDASDEKLLRQVRNNSLTNGFGGAAEGVAKGLPKAALAALIGLSGGVPGAIIGGVGSLINSGIEGYGQDTQEAAAKLQGLYSKLQQADQEYRTMKRPNGLRSAGLQSRYYNQLY